MSDGIIPDEWDDCKTDEERRRWIEREEWENDYEKNINKFQFHRRTICRS
jgi:hypothetical protein